MTIIYGKILKFVEKWFKNVNNKLAINHLLLFNQINTC
jgi:hypothetical protein